MEKHFRKKKLAIVYYSVTNILYEVDSSDIPTIITTANFIALPVN
jgi:hypothetical protein